MILHVDMDCFYVSVERLRDPSLMGKPVAVGGTPEGRGVVSSASYEARRFGVRSAMPMGEALRLCPDLVIINGKYSVYSEYSRRIEEVLESFSPMVEMASQDEAYMDMRGTERLWGEGEIVGQRVRERVMSETGLPCSVGMASNKMMAKIASGACKPAGLLYLAPGSEAAFLAAKPIGIIPGVGAKTEERLQKLGLKTAGDVQRLGLESARLALGDPWGEEIWQRAMGRHDGEVAARGMPRSISHETTFDTDTADEEVLGPILSDLAERVASRLRRHGLRAATIGIKFRYTGFETHTAAHTFPTPTVDDRVIFREAWQLLDDRRDKRRTLRLVGVVASGLTDEPGQLDLLADAPDASPRRERLMAAIDAVRERHGFGAVRSARSTPDPEEPHLPAKEE